MGANIEHQPVPTISVREAFRDLHYRASMDVRRLESIAWSASQVATENSDNTIREVDLRAHIANMMDVCKELATRLDDKLQEMEQVIGGAIFAE